MVQTHIPVMMQIDMRHRICTGSSRGKAAGGSLKGGSNHGSRGVNKGVGSSHAQQMTAAASLRRALSCSEVPLDPGMLSRLVRVCLRVSECIFVRVHELPD